ncbi:1-propanol dehydrogenase PduQ [Streptococcus catagoni]|uniref:1-propanol dehydrogenase PduQ n=1 Tax=Streptococcus catagoni TaxID=2654874 RepID=UPI00140CE237|nr:1-propanol dehydrogenase PduQ [Streptococcus catagoni]
MYSIFYKTKLFVGKGALEQLSVYRDQQILVVTDPFLKTSGQLDQILGHLDPSNDLTVFDEIVPDPPIDTVVEGIKKAGDKAITIILAIGGGSAIDAAKAMYYFAKKKSIFPQATLIAVPTTSGTGSEVTDFSVITDAEKGTKYPLVSKEILPDIAILDSNLVLSLPSQITADTGMDVLTHAIEAYVSTKATDFSDALAEKVIKLVFEYLPRAFKDGSDSEAREKMHIASTLAGMAFNTASLGVNHSLAHAAGAKFHIPHGRLNSILLPHVIRYNADLGQRVSADMNKETAQRYQAIAKLLGYSASNPALGIRQLLEAIKKLQRQLKLPMSLSSYGISSQDFNSYKAEIAESALQDKCTVTNPRDSSSQELLKVLENSF